MKAVVRDRYGAPDVLRVEDVETPVPAEGEALIRVHAASLNMADVEHLRGTPRFARVAYGIRGPRTRRVGLDVAGRVEALGPGVEGLAVGDRVWADLFDHGAGAFAELVCTPATALRPIPAGIELEAAATVPHSGGLARQGLLARGPILPGQEVLINGAGGCVGPFAVQIAKAAGAVVTAVDHTAKLDLLLAVGADHVVDYATEDVIRRGPRYDLVLDIAQSRSVLSWRRVLRPGGRHVLIARGIGGFVSAALLGAGVTLSGSRRMGTFVWRSNRTEDLDGLGELIASGAVTPVIDSRFGLEETAAAYRHLEAGRARGKIVIVPGG